MAIMINPVPTEELSRDKVYNAIIDACQVTNERVNGEGSGSDGCRVIFRIGTASDMTAVVMLLENDSDHTNREMILLQDLDLVHWITVEESNTVVAFAAFYWAYSTWDGRYLYANKIVAKTQVVEKSLLHTLADVAVRLEGQRLVFQHYSDKSPLYKSLGAEVLHEYLTLRMSIDGMDYFLSSQQCLAVETSEESGTAIDLTKPKNIEYNSTPTSIEVSIQKALDAVQSNDVELHMATSGCLHYIERFVYGLAVSVKEMDAIHVNKEHYYIDGGFSNSASPLYKCLLMWDKKEEQYCGMAVFYFGYDIVTGRFLYLEDLFIDEHFRGKGYGSLFMATLALIAKGAGGVGFVWQALDWNTRSLDFYGKIGAKVLDGLLTTRFSGAALKDFVESRHSGV